MGPSAHYFELSDKNKKTIRSFPKQIWQASSQHGEKLVQRFVSRPIAEDLAGLRERFKAGGSDLDLIQLLDAYLLYLGLPDLVRHPGWRSGGLIHLHALSYEYMHLFSSALAQLDIRVSAVGCL
jgi:hypothetical protein